MKKKQVAKGLIFLGLLLIAAALWITVNNIFQEKRAEKAAESALERLREEIPLEDASAEPEIPEYMLDSSREMSEIEADGQEYIGVLEIPALGLCLPVISEWSYPKLKLAPCRYQGSAYQNDLIIMAHNYQSHFGTLINLHVGDEVYFADTEGKVFTYAVTEIENLDGTAVEEMAAGEWDLTLFTCTIGGKTRVTVRCERI